MRTPRNIAVIAVHGVGNHEPRSSAAAIARLFLRIPRGYGSRYTSFSENPIGISTTPVPEAETEEQVLARRRRKRDRRVGFDERPERAAHNPPEPPGSSAPPADVRFMRDQLRDYNPDPSAATYDTVRMEGKHLESDAKDGSETSTVDAQIHVYEMFWSDISRIGNSVFSIFGAFYQVVIHLPYVGLITLEEAKAASATHDGWWDAWLTAYRWAVRCMTLLAPTLNIIMLAVGLGALTQRIPVGAQRAIAYTIPAILVLIGTTRVMYKTRDRRTMIDVAIPILLGVATFFAGRMYPGPIRPAMALVVEWWLIAALPLYLIFRAFQRNRPGALPLGAWLFAAATVAMTWLAVNSGQDTTRTIIGTLEWLNFGLLVTWLAFTVTTLMVSLFGVVVPFVATKTERRREALRAAYTARFALGLPAVAFAVVTLTIWGALVAGQGTSTFKGQTHYESVFTYPALARHQVQDREYALGRVPSDSVALAKAGLTDSALHVRKHALAKIDAFGGPSYFLRVFGGSSDGLPGVVGAILVGGALLLVVWVLIPVLIGEFRSPSLDKKERSNAAFGTESAQLGTWLSTALVWSRFSGEALVVATIGSALGLAIAAPTALLRTPDWLTHLAARFPSLHFGYTEVGGWVIGASAIGLYALITRLSSIGARLRPVFGIMADVDNYLRELPADRTPRARMAERYVSLLRYLCLWRADGARPDSGYDAIIIVSHSQGTVITADLLRYLKHFDAGSRAFEPHLARLHGDAPQLPIILMTMGCPLRQIYGQRFPDIYSWVGGASDPAMAAPAQPDVKALLGVNAWINLYRSGDYVGRSVWRSRDSLKDMYLPDVVWKEPSARRAEACIGPGAHTHYWDETADVVSLAIDAVVRGIIGGNPANILIDQTMQVVTNPSSVAVPQGVMPPTPGGPVRRVN